MLTDFDAIVIGAGIAGSSCALQLAREGERTLLLDRQAFPRHKTCGEFMSPESEEMLDELGLHLNDHGLTPSIMRSAKLIMPNGGEIDAPLPGQATGVSRFELDRILHEKAVEAGSELVTHTHVTGIRSLADQSYEVETKQKGKTVVFTAKAVIGAYGTKKPRGTQSSAEGRDNQCFVGIKSHFTGIHVPSRVELYFCKGGYVGLSPIENGKVNVAALLTLDTVQGRGNSVPELLQVAAQSHPKLAARLSGGCPVPGTQIGVCPIHLSNVPEPWSDYPHIGDALLMIPPLCGDGMSIALRSSRLASKWTHLYLSEEISFEEWQNGYTEAANLEFSQLLRRARRIQRLAFAPTNRLYPVLSRLIPGFSNYMVKATRLPALKRSLS